MVVGVLNVFLKTTLTVNELVLYREADRFGLAAWDLQARSELSLSVVQ